MEEPVHLTPRFTESVNNSETSVTHDEFTSGSYALQQGRKEVRVFVIDTGADVSHIDVAANLDTADSISFVPTEPTIQDFNGHGTWTISAVGAPINGVGISDVAPQVTLVEAKVLAASASGLFLWTDQALIYAGNKHFDVISASLGGYIPKCGNASTCDHPDYILLQRATQYARSNGVLPVAAMDNDGFDLSNGAFFRNFVEAPGEVACLFRRHVCPATCLPECGDRARPHAPSISHTFNQVEPCAVDRT